MRKRLIYLDIIRIIATFLIILFHYMECLEQMNLLMHPERFSVAGVSLMHLGGVNLTLGNWGVSMFLIISGAGMMMGYQHKCEVKSFYKKRLLRVMPEYYLSYLLAVLILFMLGKLTVENFSLTSIVTTLLGIDGWLGSMLPSYPLVGDWFIGLILILYLFFPALRILVNKYPRITLVTYIIIFAIYEYVYPFTFPKRNSVILRGLEFVIGMFLVKIDWKPKPKHALIALIVALFVFIVPINAVSAYVLTPIAGLVLYIIIFFFAEMITSKQFQYIVAMLSRYTFPVFLMHHFVMLRIMECFEKQTLGVGYAIGMFGVCLFAAVAAGVVVQWIYDNLVYWCTNGSKRGKNDG